MLQRVHVRLHVIIQLKDLVLAHSGLITSCSTPCGFQAGRRQQVRDARQEGRAPHQRRSDAPLRHDLPGGPAVRERDGGHLIRRSLPGRFRLQGPNVL